PPARAARGTDARSTDAPASDPEMLSRLRLLPTRPNWASGFTEVWQPGEAGASGRLTEFLEHRAPRYARDRDHPSLAATSQLPPQLRFGELSSRPVWHMAQAAGVDTSKFMS